MTQEVDKAGRTHKLTVFFKHLFDCPSYLFASTQVRSLCGGILNYYNQGGSVCDARGEIVQAVHPGISPPDLNHLVTRPNNFKSHQEE
jgi:hypothetical protein